MRKKRQEQIYQRKKRIGNNIRYQRYNFFYVYKMEKLYIKNNTKKEEREEIEMVTYFDTWWSRVKPPTSKYHY